MYALRGFVYKQRGAHLDMFTFFCTQAGRDAVIILWQDGILSRNSNNLQIGLGLALQVQVQSFLDLIQLLH